MYKAKPDSQASKCSYSIRSGPEMAQTRDSGTQMFLIILFQTCFILSKQDKAFGILSQLSTNLQKALQQEKQKRYSIEIRSVPQLTYFQARNITQDLKRNVGAFSQDAVDALTCASGWVAIAVKAQKDADEEDVTTKTVEDAYGKKFLIIYRFPFHIPC